MSLGEFRPGKSSVAAPVWDGSGAPVASVVIDDPSERLNPERLGQMAVDLTSVAARISETLGYRIS
jgi:DNA-binding IclR family transcriptional regulator